MNEWITRQHLRLFILYLIDSPIDYSLNVYFQQFSDWECQCGYKLVNWSIVYIKFYMRNLIYEVTLGNLQTVSLPI